jgi:hypothetical protein
MEKVIKTRDTHSWRHRAGEGKYRLPCGKLVPGANMRGIDPLQKRSG